MRYFVTQEQGFVESIGKGSSGTEITESEYAEIIAKLRNHPATPDGYEYRLRADTLEWELVELPPVPDPAEQEISAEEALAIITGGTAYET